ncbi:MAG: hypothetical protein ACFCU6_11120 [Balneolaceae bacterium]
MCKSSILIITGIKETTGINNEIKSQMLTCNKSDLLQAYSLPVWRVAGIPERCSGLRCDRLSACGSVAG